MYHIEDCLWDEETGKGRDKTFFSFIFSPIAKEASLQKLSSARNTLMNESELKQIQKKGEIVVQASDLSRLNYEMILSWYTDREP